MAESRYSSLTPDAILLYSLMLDRIKLSTVNGWKDDHGRIYEYFGIADIQKYLKCSKTTAIARKKELVEAGLIRSEKQKRPLPDRIYILPVISDGTENIPTRSDNPTHEGLENEPFRVGFFNPNNTEINNTDMSDTYLSADGYDRNITREIIRDNVEYDVLAEREYDMDLVDNIIELMLDTISERADTVHIGGKSLSIKEVCSRFMNLNMMDILYVIDCINHTTSDIKNTRAYLLTTLYNAPLTRKTHYQLKAQHDMPQLCAK